MSSARHAFVVVVLLGWLTPVAAESLSDPTKPWDFKPQAAIDAAAAAVPAPALSSTMISPERRIAVIDGQIVQEGDRLGAMRVIAIQPGSVRLRGPQGYSTLKLLPTPIKKVAGKATE
ncbi:MAG: MSHA biogenesis protein MshK [Pseudomonadota bacterium]|nr:MAG: MSHA biogenesis protein MshK [Pseudomonadota bacterium]